MKTIRLGSAGFDVMAWQNVLMSDVPSTRTRAILASGIFDAGTEAATVAWQQSHGLQADGVVGPMTWKAAGVSDIPVIVPVQGLDVSVMQGANIPWEAERKRGTCFVYSRCQVGNNLQIDTQFVDNTRQAMLANLFCGAYFFPFPLPHLDPIAQADMFLRAMMINGHPLGAELRELPPAFDLEWPAPENWAKWKCTPDQIVDWSLICLERIELNTGCKPIVYSYPYFLQAISKAKNYLKLVKYKLWIAGGPSYENGDGHIPDLSRERPPRVPGWDGDWLFWQHDGNGGRRLTHGVDADFNVYRMPLTELERLCQAPIVESPPDTLPETNLVFQATSNLIVEDSVHEYRKERAEQIFNTGV